MVKLIMLAGQKYLHTFAPMIQIYLFYFRFRYESNHLLDISKEEGELPTVKSLLQVLYTFPFTLKYQHGAKTLHRLEQ
jgi:hypothetical protein